MILESLMGVWKSVAGFFIDKLAAIDLPDWAAQLTDALTTLGAQLAGMSVWFNFGLGITTAGVVATVWASCLVVKIVLRIVAFVPVVGGAG